MTGNELDIKPKGLVYNYLRVRSWLRMNAGGVPNTCKSSGVKRACFFHLAADG